ncbi:hypothetical protein C8F01DRAFT_1264157 [Mycena amicta]|nr:hypothetical protein C8F01DRAFT_1264157 [Mycena amicta]
MSSTVLRSSDSSGCDSDSSGLSEPWWTRAFHLLPPDILFPTKLVTAAIYSHLNRDSTMQTVTLDATAPTLCGCGLGFAQFEVNPIPCPKCKKPQVEHPLRPAHLFTILLDCPHTPREEDDRPRNQAILEHIPATCPAIWGLSWWCSTHAPRIPSFVNADLDLVDVEREDMGVINQLPYPATPDGSPYFMTTQAAIAAEHMSMKPTILRTLSWKQNQQMPREIVDV